MREPRLCSNPSIFHPSTNWRMYRFASSGEMAPRTQKITFGPGWSGVCMVGRRAVGWAGRQGDGVSNDDFVIANEDFLYEKPKNMLTFRHVKGICRRPQSSEESGQRFGEA